MIHLQLEIVNRGHATPQRVHCDFEMAVMQAVGAELGVEPTGCLFRFDQSVYRHVQTLGIQAAYNTDTHQGIRRWVRRLMAFPLEPPIYVQDVYQHIA